MDDETAKLLAERFLKKENIADWAIKCLEKGFDSKHLRKLAATNNHDSPFRTDDYFNRTLKELNWEGIESQKFLIKYAKILAQEIIEDKIDPVKASTEIYRILINLDYPPELHGWYEIDEVIWDYEYFQKTGEKGGFYLPKEELISEIKKISEELIKQNENI